MENVAYHKLLMKNVVQAVHKRKISKTLDVIYPVMENLLGMLDSKTIVLLSKAFPTLGVCPYVKGSKDVYLTSVHLKMLILKHGSKKLSISSDVIHQEALFAARVIRSEHKEMTKKSFVKYLKDTKNFLRGRMTYTFLDRMKMMMPLCSRASLRKGSFVDNYVYGRSISTPERVIVTRGLVYHGIRAFGTHNYKKRIAPLIEKMNDAYVETEMTWEECLQYIYDGFIYPEMKINYT
jgi:hypothetical protein